jgi:hypothetical protein
MALGKELASFNKAVEKWDSSKLVGWQEIHKGSCWGSPWATTCHHGKSGPAHPTLLSPTIAQDAASLISNIPIYRYAGLGLLADSILLFRLKMTSGGKQGRCL